MHALNTFVFGVYPYLALAVFLLGSWIRFDREQYTWRSESSQLLKRGQLRLGSILFHVGVLGLFGGHAVGLLTPHEVYTALGLTVPAKQLLAMVAGGFMGGLCLLGLLLLVHRRLTEPRVAAQTKAGDRLVSAWIFITLILGLSTIAASTHHMEGGVMLLLAQWAQSIVTFQPGAADLVLELDWVYKLHLFMGMSLFVIVPFTRLVHIWSGFGTLAYLPRAWQLVRRR